MWFLGLLSFIAFILLGIMAIVSLIRRTGRAKRYFYLSIAAFGVLLIALLLDPAPVEEQAAEQEIEGTEEEREEEIEEVDEDVELEEEMEEVEDEIEEGAPIPDALVYSGSGDSVIEIDKTEEGPIMLYIKGNSDSRHFAVRGYDDDDNRTELFVNTSDPYEGITLDPEGTTTLLEINGQGDWTIESRSVRSARKLQSPGSIEGNGDEVILVEGESRLANITGNSAGRHFSIIGYSPSRNVLVNTTDSYEGTVRMDANTFLLQITAVDSWSITTE